VGTRVAPLPVRAKPDKEAPMGNWQLDPYHTQVEFSAKHFGMMTMRGHRAEVVTTADIDPEHPETSSVEATIQAASIRTHNETRDDAWPAETGKPIARVARDLGINAGTLAPRARWPMAGWGPGGAGAARAGFRGEPGGRRPWRDRGGVPLPLGSA
jgi:YceI-like domain